MPSGPVQRRLADTIVRLSREHSTPVFKPHVTLLGSIVGPRDEVLAKSAQIARHLRPFTIRLGFVDGLDEFYRCLFIRAAKTGPLMRAHLAARRICNLSGRAAYMPHLSLMYGDFSARVKEKIIGEMGGRFTLAFVVRGLHLYSTTGEPRNWHQVRRFRLK